MKGISHFFDKIKNSAIQEIQKRTAISDIIKQVIGQTIPIESISINNGVLKITASQVLKSEIYIKKKLILNKISLQLPTIKIIDIK